ncbi:MAG: FkbM family methyltransferase [Verrucomicrobia bacterium]|nr:FkbM family methyltransferase [Verrucomicrobiota bacterium]
MIKRFRDQKITFLDIGAFYGFFSSLIGTMNPENHVYAFEPNPLNYRALEKNWKMNCRHGGCFPIALSDSEGTIPFKDRSMKVSASETTMRVPAMRYDEWQKENPIKPDLIKLDVHGSEGMVLFGMQDLLIEGGFDLYFEVHSEEMLTKYSLKEIITLLYDCGWEMSELPDFRDSGASDPVPINPERRSMLEDPLKWTQKEIACERMFFCSKSRCS